ncbi:aspartate:alanine exchanger family transporter [Corallococcus sp. M7]
MRVITRPPALVVGAVAVGLAAVAFAQGTGAAPAPHGFFGKLLGALGHQPFILLFLVVAGGYALGKMQVKGVGLGSTAATLLLGLAVSLWAYQAFHITYAIPEFTSTVFFNLFIFAIGMKVGPQFIGGLQREGRHLLVLALLVPLLSALLVYLSRFVFPLQPGLVAGILSGANTATPGFGAAQSALASGAVKLPSGVTLEEARANLTTSYALLYSVSMVLFTVMAKVLPKLFGRDAMADAKAMEQQLAGEQQDPLPGTAESFLHGTAPLHVRVFRVENPEVAGQSLGQLGPLAPRAGVERVLHAGRVYLPEDGLVLHRGDEVAVAGPVGLLLNGPVRIGPEVNSPLGDVRVETVELIAHQTDIVGRTLGELAETAGHGLYLNAWFRGGVELPLDRNEVVRRGDVLRVTGSHRRLEAMEKHVGQGVRPSLVTDIITLALGVALGAFLGAITVPVGGVKFSLGSAVGLLIVSIGLSILRTHNPALGGPFPEAARELLEDLGLNVFIAILGINAGAGVASAIAGGTLTPILVVGLIAALVPPIVAWVVGQYVMKMNTAVLMGAVAGARCNSAGMRASQEATHSIIPAIGYPVTFAVSNLLLTLICYLFALMG